MIERKQNNPGEVRLWGWGTRVKRVSPAAAVKSVRNIVYRLCSEQIFISFYELKTLLALLDPKTLKAFPGIARYSEILRSRQRLDMYSEKTMGYNNGFAVSIDYVETDSEEAVDHVSDMSAEAMAKSHKEIRGTPGKPKSSAGSGSVQKLLRRKK